MHWIQWTALGLTGLVVLIFAMIGVLYVTRGTPVHRVRAPGDGEGPPAVTDPRFCQTVELLTKTEIAAGHSIEVMDCGDDMYPRLWEDLRAARRSITLQMYYCQPGRMADEFAEILTERARAGVKVLFLRDAFGSAPIPEEYWKRLAEAGVTIAVFRPTRWYELHKVQHRSHIRVVVVDGRVGFTGGFGIDDKWLGDGRHVDQWRDTTARFTGPAVRQLQATFAAGWAEATGVLLTGDHFFALDEDDAAEPGFEEAATRTRPVGDAYAGLLHAAPTLGSTPCERFMALSIAGARRRLYISNAYFVPDDDFRDMLAGAAQSGVDVRVLVPGKHNDVKSTYYAGRAQFGPLLEAGVRIFEYEASMMHAKTLVADGVWSSVGTNNFDNRSMAFNDESVLMVRDETVARRLEQIFRQDLDYSTELLPETYRSRPLWDRLLERGASAISRLL
jgi:cardiolipin synthase